MISIGQDIRYGFRMLMKNPGVTVFAAIALAMGIGANTALFSVVYGVLLSPLPFPHPEWLMMVWGESKGQITSVAGPDYLDWKKQSQVFENLAALQGFCKFSLTGPDEPVALVGWRVSANFLDTAGEPMYMSRSFTPEESQKANAQVVVLSHRLWKTQFGGDPRIIDKKITLNGQPYTVVGVAKPTLGFMDEMTQLFVPLAEEDLAQNRGDHYLTVIGRLKSGVTQEQAQAEMNLIAARLAREYVDSNKDTRIKVLPLHEMLIQQIRPAFWVLFGAVGFVLLTACVNVAGLLLAKSGARSKEIAVRRALGAGRGRIFRQVLIESVLLALIGGILGILLAMWGLDLLKLIAPKIKMTGNSNVPGFEEMGLNTPALLFTFVTSLLTGLVFGVIPAWQTSNPRIQDALKEGGRGATSGLSRHRLLSILSVVELALAMVLLAGAGLLIQSFYNLYRMDVGFNPERVLAVEMELPPTPAYEPMPARVAFYEEVLQKFGALPGVEAAGCANLQPLVPYSISNSFSIEGRPPLPPGETLMAEYRNVSLGFFETLGIRLVKGRYFNTRDTGEGTPVLIIDEEFARRYFPDEDPLGKQVRLNDQAKQIVGIVKNVKSGSFATDTFPPTMYEPVRQSCWYMMTLLARASGDPLALSSSIRQAVWSVDPNQPIVHMQAMDDVVSDSISVQRFSAILLSGMAGVALLLAVIGIYGVMAYSVSQRQHEIGIRMALGAQIRDILLLVLRKGVMLAGLGILAGLGGVLAVNRVMASLLYGIGSLDASTFALVAFLLFGSAVLASYLPARRAARIDPMRALRVE